MHVYKYISLNLFLLFVYVWFQGWQLCVRQPISSFLEKVILFLLTIINCLWFFVKGWNNVNFPPLHIGILWILPVCSSLVYISIFKKGFFTTDFLRFCLLQSFHPLLNNVSLATEARCVVWMYLRELG